MSTAQPLATNGSNSATKIARTRAALKPSAEAGQEFFTFHNPLGVLNRCVSFRGTFALFRSSAPSATIALRCLTARCAIRPCLLGALRSEHQLFTQTAVVRAQLEQLVVRCACRS
mgnify:CR=1 FL=1